MKDYFECDFNCMSVCSSGCLYYGDCRYCVYYCFPEDPYCDYCIHNIDKRE